MDRKIIHIDADCFYAAIEMRDNPRLRDIPFAVGGLPSGRGVLTTCNYLARSYGVRSAMPTRHALRLCPQLQVGPVNMPKYRDASRQLHTIFSRFTDQIEPISLDEAYLDVSNTTVCAGSATRIAQAIRDSVHDELGITVSAGVSCNKFIAKVASDWQKPNGLTVIPPSNIDAFAAALDVGKIPGVGHITGGKLAQLGLKTCADIRRQDPLRLVKRFGKFGHVLWERAHGRDDRRVNPVRSRQSVSIERTFPEDLVGVRACLEQLPLLMDQLETRITRADVVQRVHKAYVKIKFNDFSTTTVERLGTVPTETDYTLLIREGLTRKALPVRLLGVGVRLREDDTQQLALPITGVTGGATQVSS